LEVRLFDEPAHVDHVVRELFDGARFKWLKGHGMLAQTRRARQRVNGPPQWEPVADERDTGAVRIKLAPLRVRPRHRVPIY
jgi:hypothetical protein